MEEKERRDNEITAIPLLLEQLALSGCIVTIENRLHWVLDVAFREDDCRVRQGHADENLAVLRHISLNLLRREHSSHAGIHAKRLKAGWDDAYLQLVLDGVS